MASQDDQNRHRWQNELDVAESRDVGRYACAGW